MIMIMVMIMVMVMITVMIITTRLDMTMITWELHCNLHFSSY